MVYGIYNELVTGANLNQLLTGWFITPITMVFVGDISIVFICIHGVYKPINITFRGHHLVPQIHHDNHSSFIDGIVLRMRPGQLAE